jgi:hypothetical protein
MATTTPNYGWDVPTSSDYVKLGAQAIETLGDDIDATLWTALGGNYPGLRLVKKQTIGTAVSSVTVSSAFSATYDAYKIIISGGAGSTDNAQLQLTLGSTTSGYIYSFGVFASGVAAGVGSTSAPSFQNSAEFDTNKISLNFDLVNPFLAKHTIINGGGGYNLTNFNSRTGYQGVLPNTTSYTAFTLTTSSGSITGGTIYVYGYGAS